MANGYGAGLGGSAAGRRKLERVGTFKDIAKDRRGLMTAGPSMGRPSGIGYSQPGGFGPPGTGGARIRKYVDPAISKGLPGGATGAAGSGYTAPVAATEPARDYKETDAFGGPGFGPPAGGFGAGPSPWFGAGIPTPPSDAPELPAAAGAAEDIEGLAAATAVGAEEIPGAGPVGAGVPESAEEAAAREAAERAQAGDWVPVEESYEVGGARDPEADPFRGVEPTDLGETEAERETREQGDELDQRFEDLIDDYDEGWENTQDQLNARLALETRRQAEINAQLGTSVAGGFAGAMAATALGGVQALANAAADFQKGRTALQLQWLDKRVTFDERRAAEERQFHRDIIQGMLASGQEIPADLWAKGYGSEEAGRAATGTAGEAGVAGEQGEDGEFQALKNEAGDLFLGDDGLGTSGERQADPWDQEGEFYQWYARGTYLDRTYYRIDEDGNEVVFNPGVDGGRWPGDVSFIHRSDLDQPGSPFGRQYGSGWHGVWAELEDGRWPQDGGYDPSARQHVDSGYPVAEQTGIDFLFAMATSLGFADIAEMFGQGIGDGWKVNLSNADNPLSDAQFGGDAAGGAGVYYRGDNLAVPALIEVFQFISLYRHQNDGYDPTEAQIFDHLQLSGQLPIGTQSNPFLQEV